ncbi:MAG: dihydropteroate synthase [bacterium]
MEKNYYIRKITPESAEKVIQEIGFDKSYLKQALSKYKFNLYKIQDLTCPQASIIKQLALSIGADAAIHREVLTCKIDKTDILISCTDSQLKLLFEKLKKQPFGLAKLAGNLSELLNKIPHPIKIRGKTFDWTQKTYIMGILNVTPDSFSDGGKFNTPEKAFEQAKYLIQSGADIIDIGGESTKPFSGEVHQDEELNRILPVLEKIREFDENIAISIDTRHSIVAKEAIKAGADIINDVSGFDWDLNMIDVASELQVPVVIMHSKPNPETMQINPTYEKNIIDAIYESLSNKVMKAVSSGIKPENIIIDPGIGFGKTLEHNIEIIKRVKEFKSLGCALLVGVSRKSMITNILKSSSSEETEEANISLNAYMASQGANIIRVHDTGKHFKAFKVLDRILY